MTSPLPRLPRLPPLPWLSARDRLADAARRLFLDRQARFWLRALDPLLDPSGLRARVRRVVEETADVRTFVLEPGPGWRGHRAGQHTTIEVPIDGVLTRRCYSISRAPGALAITVKRVPGGRVSGWLHDHLHAGAVIGLSPAAGDFVLPEPLPPRPLFLTAGSGITPALAMLEELARRDALGGATLVHHARSREDVIARGWLEGLAREHAGFRLVPLLDDAPDGPPGFEPQRFRALVPDFAERATFLCGPPGLMTRVEALYASAGASGRLRRERFVAARPAVSAPSAAARVRLARSGQTVTLEGPGSLLEQLERA
ncbi:MAG TPA: FAD-binding oxidoreductase, partial [Polyangiaceae bacterium LLY-WYZ-15_(1-7)]|nr:FAD-binding oxidoreductase [Polyangiaceae bacterium LLY-WYZ-15_(1-7)]